MAETSDEIAELIKEIAAKHHLSIGRDDPILVLQTINNRLLENGARAQREALEAFGAQIEALSQSWSLDAKSKADRSLTAAVNVAAEAALKVLQETSSSTAMTIRAEITTGTQRLARALERSAAAARLNLIAAIVTMFAVCGLVAGLWFRR